MNFGPLTAKNRIVVFTHPHLLYGGGHHVANILVLVLLLLLLLCYKLILYQLFSTRHIKTV